MAYDSNDSSVWVATGASCVDRMTPAGSFGWNLTASLPVGSNPFGVAYDNASNDIFVTNTGSDNVTVISAASDLSVASIGVGSQPYGIAYDWATDAIYVANGGSGNVSIISGSTLAVLRTVAVGTDPIGIVADAPSGQVFVANHGSNNVSAIATGTNSVVANIGVGTNPFGVAIDDATDQIYVSNEGSQNVSVINATTDSLTGTIPVLGPGVDLQGIAYDARDGLIWVGAGASVAAVINTTAQYLMGYAGTDPSGVLYDPANGDVCVTNTANVTFECISTLWISTTYPLVFHETGLPSGSEWGVAVNQTYWLTNATIQWSDQSNITFGAWLGWCCGSATYTYQILTPMGYYASPASGNVTVVANSSSPSTVNLTMTPANGTYLVWFNESGLPLGTTWAVDVQGSSSHTNSLSMSFRVANGSYAYTVGTAHGYTPTPASGTVVVSGADVSVGITFAAPVVYPVHFSELGLQSGTLWEVWLGGATQSSTTTDLQFNMTNGTYVFVVTANQYVCPQSPGNLTVAGASVWVNVTFNAAPYSVTFYETGLPAGTFWTVTLDGLSRTGVTTVSFYEPNGTFPFRVESLAGYSVSPSSGNVTVAGLDLNVTIQFSPASNGTYVVEFTETGLPAGTLWSVTLGGITNSSTLSSLSFQEPSGVYPISVGSVLGYNSTVQATVTVTNSNLSVGVVFTPILYSLTFEETGLPNGTGWGVVIGSEVESTIGDHLTFRETTGAYDYVLLAVPGYLTHYSGTATVNGTDTTVDVAFTPQTYPIVFIEFGLPTGSNWSVTVSNASLGFNETKSSTTNSIIFFLPNGTYAVSFTLPPGYAGTSSSNLVIVAGRSVSGPTVTAQSQGSPWPPWLPAWWLLSAVIAAAVIVGAVGSWLVFRKRRPPQVAGSPPTRHDDAPGRP